ncbi:Mbov_0121 family peptidase domain-containing ABC transporter [Mycoplasmopsis verecunda]|uniref:ABC-type bacteriocin/lantibiotic exporter, contains an N-terminal double-glycine peptidase domain n=1 Tax=Mycoplasmopsis verecunda TaxID=171291 RepID=A0A1T4L1D8_9BACT|nr:cysteine peptidase family C39 domain-containing protein [Mycoplasmopsis verecunda]WPB54386.1 cysteine peptidase family C39 domain-containing protein [Mycoplasmopsis verecunda]SJZ48534.1 ABC-type bacteriocin/lantibiotic exporter, contains an N-terminal double-glycine peptidase domain [Mycoplasmopsis verecunda]
MSVKQVDTRDCSLYVLKWFYDRNYISPININELKLNAKYTEKGISIPDFETICNSYNFDIEIYNCEKTLLPELDRNELPVGTLISMNDNTHMVVIKKISSKYIYVYDPVIGNTKYRHKDFLEKFSGLLIKFTHKRDDFKSKKTISKNNWLLFDKFSLFYLISLISETLILFSLPYFNKIILEKIIPNKLNIHLLYLGIIFVFIILLNFSLKNLSQKILQKLLAQRRESQILNFIAHLKFNNYKVIDKLTPLEIKNRVSVFDNLIEFQIIFLPEILSGILTILLALILLWNINIYLMIIILTYSILNLILSFFTKSIYEKNLPKLLQQNIQCDNAFNNYINHIMHIHNYFLEEKLQNELSREYQNLNDAVLRFKIKNTTLNTLQSSLDIIAPLCILILGSYQIWGNKLNTINLIFFITGASLFTKPIKNIVPLTNLYSEYTKSFAMLKIFNINDSAIKETELLKDKIQEIALLSVSYSYTESKLNNALNIRRLKLSDKHKLKGKNGSGKTTLCALLNGSKQADSGEILINGEKINLFLDKKYKQKVIYIGKDNNLNISVLDYLCIYNIKQFNELIDHFGLQECISHLNINLTRNISISSLSSGQKQFISLLSLFLLSYDVVLLDEAFENLDNFVFMQLKNKLQKILNNSIVIEISHNNKYIFDQSKEIDVQEINS